MIALQALGMAGIVLYLQHPEKKGGRSPMTENQPAGLVAAVKKSLHELAETFAAFLKAPRALWGVNIPYVFEGLVYFGILTILGKFCSENVALSDIHSGWVYGGVTGGITFAMLLFGGVSDKIGVRVSLALSLAVMMVGRILVALSGTLSLGSGMGSPMFLLMAAGLLLMVAAYGLYMPAAYAGVKRYTNPQTAAIGYAVIYGLMNLGAFLSGFVSSNTRHAFAGQVPAQRPDRRVLDLFRHHPVRLAADPADHHPQGRPPGRRAGRPRDPGDEHRRTEPGRRRQGRRPGKKVAARVPLLPFLSWIALLLAALALVILTRLGKLSLARRRWSSRSWRLPCWAPSGSSCANDPITLSATAASSFSSSSSSRCRPYSPTTG